MRSDRHDRAADENPGSDMDEVAARMLRSAWNSSPGIVVSLIFHGAMLALLPLIIFSDQVRESLGIPVTIGINARRVDPERPYRPIESGPPAASGRGLDEPPVFFPDAVEAERNEAKGDGQENATERESRGVLQHVAEDPTAAGFRGRLAKGPPGTNDIMGVGGGSGQGGARKGAGKGGTEVGRGAGRRDLVARGGGSKETEMAVELGLSWLCRHQKGNGSWESLPSCKDCSWAGDAPGPVVGTTGLAALAFMTAGYGPNSQVEIIDRATDRKLSYGKTVRAALEWLGKRQGGQSHMLGYNLYEHSFATLALCEAYRQTRTEEAKKRAELAVSLLVKGQAETGEWGYNPFSHGDTSVTGACVQALRSARMAGIDVPQATLDKLRRWMSSVTTKEGAAGYNDRSDGGASLTAIGLYARRYLDPGPTVSDKVMPLAAKRIGEGVGSAQFNRNLYLWYYAMLGLYEYEAPGGASWKSVNGAVTTALVSSQHREDKCIAGAWDDSSDQSFAGQGRPFVTAVSVLTLETYYRYVDSAEKKPATKTTGDSGAEPRKSDQEKPAAPQATAAPK